MIIPFDELRLKIIFMEQQENNDLKEAGNLYWHNIKVDLSEI